MGAAMLLPRKVFHECGGWDGEFAFGGEDLDLSARVGKRYLIVYHPSVEITHYGRASSRQHIGFVSSNMAIASPLSPQVRLLERALWGYKLAVTLDAPVQFVGKPCNTPAAASEASMPGPKRACWPCVALDISSQEGWLSFGGRKEVLST